MAPSFKGKRKKKAVPMAESESQNALGLAEETAVQSPGAEEHQNSPEKMEEAETPETKACEALETGEKSPAEDSGDEQMPSSEKEEEQAFLVNLYKFMKDRHTPIERVPHLGFKQINLFKIYKVVEKLGAYELVTGRRLWKNVYDMLGGSPGSTSAATCTRRHYERLVLPYVRHLKGEDDKPLPPAKPRKQYKVSKESKEAKGIGAVEKKRVRKEKPREQIFPEKPTPDAASAAKPAGDPEKSRPQEQAEGYLSLSNGREAPESQASEGCGGKCRGHDCSEAYQRLFSSFYFKGNHGIMSPLAKKKLLAQVSKDESLYRHLSHCPEYKKSWVREIPDSDAEAGPKTLLAASLPPKEEGQTPVREVGVSIDSAGSSQPSKASGGESKASLSLTEGQKADDACCRGHPSPGLPLARGYFHTPRGEAMKPISCPPLRGPVEYYGGFKSFPEVTIASAYQQPGSDVLLSQKKQESLEDQPEDLRQKPSQPLPSWRGGGQQQTPPFQVSKRGPSPFPHAKPSWVTPGANLAKVSPQVPKNGGQLVSQEQAGSLTPKKRVREEELFLQGKKLKAVAPFVQEVQSSNGLERGTSPSGQQVVTKPKAALPSSCFPVAPVLPDMYKGTMLRLPVNFSTPREHLKGQSASLVPSLSISPFIIPAFPTPLLTASIQPSDLCQPLAHYATSYDSVLRHRLYPVSTWHSQPAYASPHVPAFQRNTKL